MLTYLKSTPMLLGLNLVALVLVFVQGGVDAWSAHNDREGITKMTMLIESARIDSLEKTVRHYGTHTYHLRRANNRAAYNAVQEAWRLLNEGEFEEVLRIAHDATYLNEENEETHLLAAAACVELGEDSRARFFLHASHYRRHRRTGEEGCGEQFYLHGRIHELGAHGKRRQQAIENYEKALKYNEIPYEIHPAWVEDAKARIESLREEIASQ